MIALDFYKVRSWELTVYVHTLTSVYTASKWRSRYFALDCYSMASRPRHEAETCWHQYPAVDSVTGFYCVEIGG